MVRCKPVRARRPAPLLARWTFSPIRNLHELMRPTRRNRSPALADMRAASHDFSSRADRHLFATGNDSLVVAPRGSAVGRRTRSQRQAGIIGWWLSGLRSRVGSPAASNNARVTVPALLGCGALRQNDDARGILSHKYARRSRRAAGFGDAKAHIMQQFAELV